MIEMRQVLEASGCDEPARPEVMRRFKTAGGLLDRWHIADQWAMADAISCTEDSVELRVDGKWTPVRGKLRTIRSAARR